MPFNSMTRRAFSGLLVRWRFFVVTGQNDLRPAGRTGVFVFFEQAIHVHNPSP